MLEKLNTGLHKPGTGGGGTALSIPPIYFEEGPAPLMFRVHLIKNKPYRQ